MIHYTLFLIISLLFAIFFLMMIGAKLRIAYPIFLVFGGLAIGFIPSIPEVNIDPDIVFLIFLPPLLYEAAWSTSWYEFWKNRITISSLGFGLVIATSCIVAYLAHTLMAPFTLALGFLVGGIISPPDAVATTSILKMIKVPKRLLATLEGESLVNDASSLIVYRFALSSIIATETFLFKDAVMDFFIVTFGGIFLGILIAFIIYIIHKIFPTNTNMDVGLTLVSPYIMYMAAEYFHFSGVMSVVSGGLFLSYRYRDFLNYQSYMQAMGTWKTIAFILNGFVFILIGLELPIVVRRVTQNTLHDGIKYGLIISGIAIILRILWTYLWVYGHQLINYFRNQSTPKDAHWKDLFLIGWAGMRGMVSLAAALSIPITIAPGIPFPHRDLILLITFVVILITLVFQGLMLPLVVKTLRIRDDDEQIQEKEEQKMELRLMYFTRQLIRSEYAHIFQQNTLCQHYIRTIENRMDTTEQRLRLLKEQHVSKDEALYIAFIQSIIARQRAELRRYRKANMFEEYLIRKKEVELDLIEARVRGE